MPQAAGAIKVIAAAVAKFFTAQGFWYALARFVVFTAASYALSRRQNAFNPGLQGREISTRGTVENMRIVYGECMTSGPVVYVNTSGDANEKLWILVAHAGHECEAIGAMQFDQDILSASEINGGAAAGGDVTTGKYAINLITTYAARVEKYLGTSSQAASATMIADFPAQWTSAHRLRGICYTASRFVLTDASENLWNSSQPQNIRALVKGKKVYDPRLDTSPGANPTNAAYIAWSDNPALCVADYATDTRLGLGIAPARISWASVVTAANHCDELVSIPGGTQKRYTCNGVLYTSSTHSDNMEQLLSSMNGQFIKAGGLWTVYAGQYIAPDPADAFDENHLAGPITIKTSIGRADRVNTARGIYVDPQMQYKPAETPPIQIASLLARDNGVELAQDYELPFTNDYYMAQRVVRKRLQLAAREVSAVIPMNFHAARMPTGERLTLSIAEAGWSNQVAVVEGWKLIDAGDVPGVELTVRLDEESDYDDPEVLEYELRLLAGFTEGGQLLPLGLHVQPPDVHWGEASVDFDMLANEDSAGATSNGKVHITPGGIRFLDQLRTISADVQLNSPLYTGSSYGVPTGGLLIFSGGYDVSTRFPTLTNLGSAEADGLFLGRYDRSTDTYWAVDGNGNEVQFTPEVLTNTRDIVIGRIWNNPTVQNIAVLQFIAARVNDASATNGAQIGVNLTDSGGSAVNDADVLNDSIVVHLQASRADVFWSTNDGAIYEPQMAEGGTDTQDVVVRAVGNGVLSTVTWRWTAQNTTSSNDDTIQSGAFSGSSTGWTAGTVSGTGTKSASVTLTHTASGQTITLTASILQLNVSAGK